MSEKLMTCLRTLKRKVLFSSSYKILHFTAFNHHIIQAKITEIFFTTFIICIQH